MTIQYFHAKSTTFDVFTFSSDIGISVDSWNLLKAFSEICDTLIKKVLSTQIIYKKGKALGWAHLAFNK